MKDCLTIFAFHVCGMLLFGMGLLLSVGVEPDLTLHFQFNNFRGLIIVSGLVMSSLAILDAATLGIKE